MGTITFTEAVAPTPTATAAEWVERTGKLFECGAWPDRAFTFTEADADAAVAAFAPVPLEIEHFSTQGRASILDGQLGTVQRLWRDGATLQATVRVPTWLDSLWAPRGRKISAVWDTASKRLAAAGLVVTPAIADATLFAAFAGSRHSAADLKDMQLMHDAATRQGAACPDGAGGTAAMSFAGARHSAADTAELQLIHDTTVRQGAQCAAAPGAGTKGTTSMSKLEEFGLWLEKFSGGGGIPPPAPSVPPPGAAPPLVPAPDPAFAALQARFAALETERDTERAAARQAQAVTFADAQITGHKALPAERDTLIALYVAAATDDALAPRVVTFGAGGSQSGSRVDALGALYAARPAHTLTAPALESTVFSAGTAEKAAPTPEAADAADLATRTRAYAARANGHKEATS